MLTKSLRTRRPGYFLEGKKTPAFLLLFVGGFAWFKVAWKLETWFLYQKRFLQQIL